MATKVRCSGNDNDSGTVKTINVGYGGSDMDNVVAMAAMVRELWWCHDNGVTLILSFSRRNSHCLPSLGFLAPPNSSPNMVLQNDIDLLNPPAELEKRKHKLKRLVQSPNSFFMDVKCQGCFNITTVFSHSQTVVVCGNCQTVLCQPTGGRARLTEGCSFRKKGD
ncbi:40S ribosomal protein S27-2 [Glycine max]|nr:40S ribosomal protein S27-2 [Glycine max]